MAVRTRDEIITSFREYAGDRTDDVTISFIEDVTDTLNSLSDGEDWKRKYEENDSMWRRRYIDRFENGNQIKKDIAEDEISKSEENAETAETDMPDNGYTDDYTSEYKKEIEESVFNG